MVVSALDAKNNFDLDGWLAAFEGGGVLGVDVHGESAEVRHALCLPCDFLGTGTGLDDGAAGLHVAPG